MEKKPIYTIGHGNRKIEEFLKILKVHKVEYLIDVRSKPYSKFNPQYNQSTFKVFLHKNGVKYIFMGDTIGGRPNDSSCYDSHGKVDYESVKMKDFFLQGIDRLKTAYAKDINVIIMCSESNPCECHRSKLIGRVLDIQGIILKHIDESGKLKDQVTVINELNKGFSETDLFGESKNTKSRKTYL